VDEISGRQQEEYSYQGPYRRIARTENWTKWLQLHLSIEKGTNTVLWAIWAWIWKRLSHALERNFLLKNHIGTGLATRLEERVL
jgi:hypothetical protein